jgi:hypothetical protein
MLRPKKRLAKRNIRNGSRANWAGSHCTPGPPGRASGNAPPLGGPTAVSIEIPAPVRARPLERRWCWPFILFQLPAVYQPLPVSILWRRCRKRIALLIGVGVGSRRRAWRGNLRQGWTCDGYAQGGRDANRKIPHPPVSLCSNRPCIAVSVLPEDSRHALFILPRSRDLGFGGG